MPKTLTKRRTSEIIQEWLDTLNRLYAQIEEWAEGEGWACERGEMETSEALLGAYAAPTLTLFADDERLQMEPFSRSVRKGDGVVELYALPTLRRVWLVKEMSPPLDESRTEPPAWSASSQPEQWVVLTDSGIPLHQEWNQQNFIRLVRDLLYVR